MYKNFFTNFLGFLKLMKFRKSASTENQSKNEKETGYTVYSFQDRFDLSALKSEIYHLGEKDYRTMGIHSGKSGDTLESGLNQIRESFSAAKETSDAQFHAISDAAKTQYQSKKEKLEEFRSEEYANNWKVKSDMKLELKPIQDSIRIAEQDMKHENDVAEKLAEKKDDILYRQFQDQEPVIPFYKKPRFYIIVICFVLFGEWAINYGAMQQVAPEANILLIILTTMITAVSGLSSHFLGERIRKRNKKSSIALLLILAGVTLFVSGMRIYGEQSLLLTIINILFISFCIYYAYAVAPYLEITLVDAQLLRSRKNFNQAESNIASHQEDISTINEKYEVLAIEAAKEEKSNLKTELKDYGAALSQVERQKKIQEARLTELELKCLNDYRTGFEFGRKYTSKAKSNGVPSGSIFSCLMMLIALTGCLPRQDESEPIGILIDVTDPQTVSSSAVLGAIYKRLPNSEKAGVPLNEIKIYLGRISNVSLNEVWEINLPKAESYLLRSEKSRREAWNVFKSALETKIDSFLSIAQPRTRSFVNRNIASIVEILKKHNGHGTLIIASDLLNNQEGISFYDFKHDPSLLKSKKGEIFGHLTRDRNVDLTGMSIMVLHRPSVEQDELIENTRSFWREYFELKGAKNVTFSAN